MPQVTVVEVVAGIIVEEGRALMTQRMASDRFPDLWEFPGGKVDPGENHAEALVRELREELAIQTRVGALYDTVRYDALGGVRLDIYFYFAERLQGEPCEVEVQAWTWSGPSSLRRLDIIPSNRSVVARLVADLEAAPGKTPRSEE